MQQEIVKSFVALQNCLLEVNLLCSFIGYVRMFFV